MRTLAVVGCGAIGSSVLALLRDDPEVRVTQVIVPSANLAEARALCAAAAPHARVLAALDREGGERPDLLVIDTEGHDWAIIRSIDLASHGPRLLIYEHFHLSREDRAACLAHLQAAGYETLEEGFDTLALRPEDDALTRRFRELEPHVGGVAKYEETA